MKNVHIYHLDLWMIFDHFSVVRIHARCFDDEIGTMSNDEQMNDDRDHPFKGNFVDHQDYQLLSIYRYRSSFDDFSFSPPPLPPPAVVFVRFSSGVALRLDGPRPSLLGPGAADCIG